MENKQSLSSPADERENIMGTMDINPLLIKLSVPMMVSMLVQALYNVVDSYFVAQISEDAQKLFQTERVVIGKCPRCGAEVTESPKGFFCENRACSFVLWKNSRFFTAKKKVLTKSLAAALLKNGRAPLKGCYSEKTGKTYDASVLLEDDGQRTGYKMVFDNG